MNERIAVTLLLLVLSIIDIKKRVIPHWGILALFLISFFSADNLFASLCWCIYAFAGLSLGYIITKGGIGGGDVKLLTALAFHLGAAFPILLGYLLITSLLGFLAGFISCRKIKVSLPLAPFILIAYILMIV